MKANRTPQANYAAALATTADSGVSSVVAAVLLFALFTTMSVLWTINTLPDWIEDRESNQQTEVQEGFGTLKAGLDALSAQRDSGPISAGFSLAAKPVALFQRDTGSGVLGFETGFTVGATFTGESILLLDGASSGLPDEVVNGDVLTDVQTLNALILSLSTTTVGTFDTAWVDVSATDAVDTATARITHAGTNAATSGCNSSELRIAITGPLGSSTQPIFCDLDTNLPAFKVDLLDSLYGFGANLDRLQPGYTITLTVGAAGGSAAATALFAASYLDSAGLYQGAGSGQATDYTLAASGGSLLYQPSYRSFVQQDVVWEGGSVLVAQGQAQAIVSDPAFELQLAGGVGHLQWTIVTLTGSGSLGGSGRASVEVTHMDTDEILLQAAGGVFTITSDHAAAWRNFLDDQVLLSGAGTDVVVGGTGTTATLTLSSTTVTEWRIRLRLVEATVTVS